MTLRSTFQSELDGVRVLARSSSWMLKPQGISQPAYQLLVADNDTG